MRCSGPKETLKDGNLRITKLLYKDKQARDVFPKISFPSIVHKNELLN